MHVKCEVVFSDIFQPTAIPCVNSSIVSQRVNGIALKLKLPKNSMR